MKQKLSLMATILIGMTATSHAEFYVGPKIGASFNVGEYKNFDTNNTQEVREIKGGAGLSFLGGINGGYFMVLDKSNIFFGINVSLMAQTLNNSEVLHADVAGNPNPKVALKNSFYYGVGFQAGYKMDNGVIPYVMLGAAGGRYKVTLTNDGAERLGLDTGTRTMGKTVLGFNPGLGVKFGMGKRLMGVVQYDALLGPKIAKTFTNTAGVAATYEHVQRIQQHNITFSVVYPL